MLECTLKCNDCLEELKKLKENSVDLIVTDPPYIMPENAGGAGVFTEHPAFREIYSAQGSVNLRNGFDFAILEECRRVSKTLNMYVFCNVKLLAPLLHYFRNDLYDVLIWHKPNHIKNYKYMYITDLEYIVFVCNDRKLLRNNANTSSKLFIKGVMQRAHKETSHPTEKPMELIEQYVYNSSKEGDVVLDPFMGSGTTGKVALSMGRKFIGFEKEKRYFEQAQKRLQNIQPKFKEFR